MSFHEVRFPDKISYGARGGPKRLTQIVTLKSGFEERNQSWQHSRRKYNASMGIRRLKHLEEVMEFWEARRGQLYGFRWKDWADFKSCRISKQIEATDQLIDLGDGTKTIFQLVKRYISEGEEYIRPVRKPVAGTLVVAVAGVVVSNYTIDYSTGLITFNAAPTGNVTAGYEYDVPVRFDSDSLEISYDGFEAGSMPDINIIEIRT